MSVSRDKVRDNYLRLIDKKFFFIVGWLRYVFLIPTDIGTRKHVCQWKRLPGSFVGLCFGGHFFSLGVFSGNLKAEICREEVMMTMEIKRKENEGKGIYNEEENTF